MKVYGEDVLREAGRLEASLHVGGGDPMITNSMVQEADIRGRRGQIQRPTPKFKHAMQLVSYAAAVVAGVFASNMDDAAGSIGFAISAPVGIIAFFLGRNDD